MTKFLSIISFLVLFSACAETASSETETAAAIDDFNEFYEKFHSDSLYQKEHVLFPLQGIPSNADSAILADKTFRWQEENWVTQRKLPSNSEFSSTIIPVDEGLMIERIMHYTGDYAMERRFAKMSGDWKLIYYAGVNRVKK